MRLLLPPSETKLKGGLPHKGRLTLSFAVQDEARARVMAALEEFSVEQPDAAAKALKLGPKSIDELANNLFTDAPLLPAIDRYTGVLYSATGVSEWTDNQRVWAGSHVFIHSSLFGIISANDRIPAYRLSYDTKLPTLSLKSVCGEAQVDAIREMSAGDWVLDCRSEGYRNLAPIPAEVPSRYLEVVAVNGGKALNHFNKVHKGELVNALVTSTPELESPEALAEWAITRGLDLQVDGTTVTLAI